MNIDSFIILLGMRVKEGNKETAILEAAIEVFAENGFHNSKMSKIAEVAGVASGSIYLYYKSKEDILEKIFRDIWIKLFGEVETLHQRDDMDVKEKIDHIVDVYFDMFIGKPLLAKVFVSEISNISRILPVDDTYYQRFLELGEEIIQSGINKNIINPNLNIKVFRYFLLGGIRNLLLYWANNYEEMSISTIRQNIKFIMKRGVLL